MNSDSETEQMNRPSSPTVALTCLATCVTMLVLMCDANANQSDFTELYNYYFPKEMEYTSFKEMDI